MQTYIRIELKISLKSLDNLVVHMYMSFNSVTLTSLENAKEIKE